MSKFLDFKPGDLIEWIHGYTENPITLVGEDEEFYSSIQDADVPVGSNLVHMCVYNDGETYSWLNERGVFRAHIHDVTWVHGFAGSIGLITPRVRK